MKLLEAVMPPVCVEVFIVSANLEPANLLSVLIAHIKSFHTRVAGEG